MTIPAIPGLQQPIAVTRLDSSAGIIALGLGGTGNSALFAELVIPYPGRADGLGGCRGRVYNPGYVPPWQPRGPN